MGRYRLEHRLGGGGMAEVWRAVDTRLDRPVAVKTIRPELITERTFLERFMREARLVAALEHPNIVPIYDFGEESGAPYLVMPLMTGGTLADRVRERIAPATALDWIARLADALDTAHAAGVLHRDVKPANILMDRNHRPMLADFGLARVAGSASDLTASGMIVGTPHYMAPELARGAEAGASADRYALAVLAYQLLTGRLPFTGETPVAVLHQHVDHPAPPVSRDAPELADADPVFFRALSKEPVSRFPSATDFARALAHAMGVPVPPRRETVRTPDGEDDPGTPRPSTEALLEGALSVPSQPGLPAPVTAEGQRSGPGRAWTILLVSLFAALGVLLGARSLLVRSAHTKPGIERSLVGSSGRDTKHAVPSRDAVDTPRNEPVTIPRLRRPRRLTATDFDAMARRADTAQVARPDDPDPVAMAGFAAAGLAYLRGDDDAARAALDEARAARGEPPVDVADWELALVLGDPRGDGLERVETHLATRPDDVRASMGRAVILHLDGRHEQAIVEASRIESSLAPERSEVRGELLELVAEEQAELGRWPAALSTFEQVAELDVGASGRCALAGARIARERFADDVTAVRLMQTACDAGVVRGCSPPEDERSPTGVARRTRRR